MLQAPTTDPNDQDEIAEDKENKEYSHQVVSKETDLKTPLLTTTVNAPQVSVLTKTLSFALTGMCVTSLFVANGKLLVVLGKDGSGASSLVSPYQSLFQAIAMGPCFAAGLSVGTLIGKGEHIRAGNVMKASWILTIGLGTLTSGAMIAFTPIFPHLFSEAVATTAISYIRGVSLVNIPLMMYFIDTQLTMSEGHWLTLPLSGIPFAVGGTALCYVLAFPAGLGALGIGLGTSIANIAVCASIKLWLLHPAYKKYYLYQHGIQNLKIEIYELGKMGWRLSIQRLTEWGNLLSVTFIIGVASSHQLESTAPAILTMTIAASALQSLAQALGISINKNKGARELALSHNNFDEARQLALKNKSAFKKNILIASTASVVTGGIVYIARGPIVNFFLNSPTQETIDNAATVLWITMLPGLLFDSIRIVSIGTLRSWKDLLYPAYVSLLTMTVIGVPLGYALMRLCSGSQSETSEAALMFYVRDASMAIAAGITGHRVMKYFNSDIEIEVKNQNSSQQDRQSRISIRSTSEASITSKHSQDEDDEVKLTESTSSFCTWANFFSSCRRKSKTSQPKIPLKRAEDDNSQSDEQHVINTSINAKSWCSIM